MRSVRFVFFVWFLLLPVTSDAKVLLYGVPDVLAEGSVGAGCRKSYYELRDFLVSVFENTGEFRWMNYENAYVPSEDRIIVDIQKLKANGTITEQDVLWFYYCGHGGYEEGKGHLFTPSSGSNIRYQEVLAAMKATNVKGILMTLDNCSTRAYYKPDATPAGGAPEIIKIDHLTPLRSLLLGTEGTVVLSAATMWNKAFMDPNQGANFTNALWGVFHDSFENLDLNGDRRISWREVFPMIRERTQASFAYMKHRVAQDNIFPSPFDPEDKDQIPWAISLGKEDESPDVIRYFYQGWSNGPGENNPGVKFVFATKFPANYVGTNLTADITFWTQNNQQLFPANPNNLVHQYQVYEQQGENFPIEMNLPYADLVIPKDATGRNIPVKVWLRISYGGEKPVEGVYWLNWQDGLDPR